MAVYFGDEARCVGGHTVPYTKEEVWAITKKNKVFRRIFVEYDQIGGHIYLYPCLKISDYARLATAIKELGEFESAYSNG